MVVLETLGIVAALGVIALMAFAPFLMTLNDEHPSRASRRPVAPRAGQNQHAVSHRH